MPLPSISELFGFTELATPQATEYEPPIGDMRQRWLTEMLASGELPPSPSGVDPAATREQLRAQLDALNYLQARPGPMPPMLGTNVEPIRPQPRPTMPGQRNPIGLASQPRGGMGRHGGLF